MDKIPNPNVVRVVHGTGYRRVEGNRRASRNGPVSDLPPEIPNVTIRNFCISLYPRRGVQGANRQAVPALRQADLRLQELQAGLPGGRGGVCV
jgi:hypothetical protein